MDTETLLDIYNKSYDIMVKSRRVDVDNLHDRTSDGHRKAMIDQLEDINRTALDILLAVYWSLDEKDRPPR